VKQMTLPRRVSQSCWIMHAAPSNPRLKTDVENARLKGSLSSPGLSRISLDLTSSPIKDTKFYEPIIP
jgi:hypothetical protein